METRHESASPQERARIEEERTLSDAELIKGGARIKFEGTGGKRLNLTEQQWERAESEMKEAQKNKPDRVVRYWEVNEDQRHEALLLKKSAYDEILEGKGKVCFGVSPLFGLDLWGSEGKYKSMDGRLDLLNDAEGLPEASESYFTVFMFRFEKEKNPELGLKKDIEFVTRFYPGLGKLDAWQSWQPTRAQDEKSEMEFEGLPEEYREAIERFVQVICSRLHKSYKRNSGTRR